MWPDPRRVRRYHPGMVRRNRVCQGPRVEVLEDRQLLTGSGPWLFDFTTARSPDTEGVVKVVGTPSGIRSYTAGGNPLIPLAVSAGSDFTGKEGATVTFNGSVSGGTSPYSYAWNFGDGSTSSGSLTRTHVYIEYGTYTATLTVTDSAGNSLSASVTATIQHLPPTARETVPAFGYLGTSLGFSASATAPNPYDQAEGFTFTWNFGDGATGTGASPTHTYSQTGTYAVSVVATDEDGGRSAAVSRSVTIGPAFTAGAGSDVTADEGSTITFAGTASGGFNPLSFFWDFGDGAAASGSLAPSHIYKEEGSYTATLIVIDARGTHIQSSVVATINAVAPTVSVTGPTSGNVGSPVTFVASATSPSSVDRFTGFTYNWDFGDGTTASTTDMAPDHTYTSAGTYTVSVKAIDNDGDASAVATSTIAVAIPTIIPIDANWIAQNGPGPYLLNQAGATYQLQTDVTTSGTAFVIGGSNITFDLNGHTITYDNAPPITVPNGDFEADPVGSSTITGWNTSGSPNSTFDIAPNNEYLFGSNVLQWTVAAGVTARQVIRSSNIAIPQANLVYTASITTTALNIGPRVGTLKMEVVDAKTGRIMQNFNRLDTSPWHGGSATFSFVPTTTNPVYLRVTLTPNSGSGACSVILDRAVLSQSMDYGILASHTSPSLLSTGTGNTAHGGTIAVSGVTNLPTAMAHAYNNVSAPTIIDSIGTGAVVQGQGGGAYCNTIVLTDTPGAVKVQGITTLHVGRLHHGDLCKRRCDELGRLAGDQRLHGELRGIGHQRTVSRLPDRCDQRHRAFTARRREQHHH